MKIKCIDAEECKGLTEGKVYETERLFCMTYTIINDLGHKDNYFGFHFKVIEDGE